MQKHRVLPTFVLAFIAPAIVAASCGDATTEVGSDYDALVGRWSATSFVVSDGNDPGHAAADLTLASPGRGQARKVTILFHSDRTGSLNIEGRTDSEGSPAQHDEFSVLAATGSSLRLAVSADGARQTVSVEYFHSALDSSLTLSFSYPLDLDGEGHRQTRHVIATFQREF